MGIWKSSLIVSYTEENNTYPVLQNHRTSVPGATCNCNHCITKKTQNGVGGTEIIGIQYPAYSCSLTFYNDFHPISLPFYSPDCLSQQFLKYQHGGLLCSLQSWWCSTYYLYFRERILSAHFHHETAFQERRLFSAKFISRGNSSQKKFFKDPRLFFKSLISVQLSFYSTFYSTALQLTS